MPVVAHMVKAGGTDRELLVAAPADAPTAIVLSLHGSTSTAEGQVGLSRMAAWAEHGAVVAFPHGSIASRAGWEWDPHRDVALLDAAVEYLRERWGAPEVPLCVCGMSGGARMASRYTSSHRHPVRVLGAVAGLRMPAVPRLDSPVRVVAFHGTRDRINPYAGGRSPRWEESVLEAAAAWARANGHSVEAAHTQVTPALTRISYGVDGDPGAVTLWVCEGAGHTWPGTHLSLGLRLLLGTESNEVDATTEIWRAVEAAAVSP